MSVVRRKQRLLTEMEKKILKEAFELFDSNNDGYLDYYEFKATSRCLGFHMKKHELLLILETYARNNKNLICYDDFFEVMEEKMLKRDPLDEIKEAFKLIANDKTKTITFRDLKYAAEKVGADIPDRDLRSMIEEFDGIGMSRDNYEWAEANRSTVRAGTQALLQTSASLARSERVALETAEAGGVDSAVAALLLKKKGYNVVGLFMRNWDLSDENGICTIDAEFEDAKYACKQLKIPIHEVNFVKEYWNDVFMKFIEDYQEGRTPNPDILCNKYIKFKAFWKYAIENLKMDALATGHYVKTSFGAYLENWDEGKNVKLLQARDRFKDQTFFLSRVSQKALQRVMFPLGDLTKMEVKQIALENGLEKLAKKPESMGICFIGSRNYQKFISDYITAKPGNFINVETGSIEGTHNGIHLFTIGQRCRIGGLREPMYVVKKNLKSSEIMVAPGRFHPSLYSSIFLAENPYWICNPPDLTFKAELDFKFQHIEKLVKCEVVSMKDDKLLVIIEKPLRALTPGQFAVFYKDNECLGSARICNIGPLEYSLGRTIPPEFVENEVNMPP
ncbi:hypothetical protein RUM44_000789 [Polyplax serrata]|uniref:tRNA-5-taurinomethyluridine 2-sulfurtransferase n=1 Tax=Polyplax serrata TaxID=468196 RepID=A0ABR1B779_POLSC